MAGHRLHRLSPALLVACAVTLIGVTSTTASSQSPNESARAAAADSLEPASTVADDRAPLSTVADDRVQLSTSDDSVARDLHALFEEDWRWRLEEFPELGTWVGDHRRDDRLSDLSPEAIGRRKAHEREMLERVRGIGRARLSDEDALSYDLFLREHELAVRGQRFLTELMPIDQMNGAHLSFPQLVSAMPFRTPADYRKYLARLAAYPRLLDQTMALMRQGIERGWVWPAVPLRSVPDQIAGQIVDDPVQSPLYAPFVSFPDEVPEAERETLAAEGRRLIAEGVVPALRELHGFVTGTYLPAARAEIAASSLPEGVEYYAHAVRLMTTTDLSPREIHEIGLREVARIRGEMEEVIRRVGFDGTVAEFADSLRTDTRFYYTEPEDLVTGYRDIAKRADAELPKLFAVLPRTPYGVREIPAYEAPAQVTAYYQQGAADGSRAGFYWVNTYKLETRPKYEMEALSLHEAVPGHHLQIARAQELDGLPEFRRNGGTTAYIEGWALYAERLGSEMGFYTDPYSRFGQLTYEMWRACRLVVDTGMHALGWSRERAIELLEENTAKTENDIVVEVDRYLVMPGQALAYKIGELKIRELRARAERELGERFDVRRFHNAILDEGALPLDVLERRIDAWIAEQKAAGP